MLRVVRNSTATTATTEAAATNSINVIDHKFYATSFPMAALCHSSSKQQASSCKVIQMTMRLVSICLFKSRFGK